MSIIKHVDLETLSNIINAIPSNIFFKDTDLRYIFSSHIWEQVDNGGDENFDIYGKTDRDIRKDTANVDNVEIADRKILDTGDGTRYTIKSVVDGHIQHLELVKEPVRDSEGNIIGIVGLINDVTSVTEEITEMLENEKLYRDAMKKGAQLAYEVNVSGDMLENDLIESLNGEEFNLLEYLGLKAPCSYTEMVHKYAEAVLCGECRQEYLDFHNIKNLTDLYNDGEREVVKEFKLNINGHVGAKTEKWFYETVLLMRNTKGEIIAFFSVNDITEQRQKEEEVRRQLEENVREAERVANMKSDFLANMSHEIRTPMNAVIGMAEMALREELSESARDYINQIKSSGRALLNIINDILDFSKIESGKMDIIPDKYEPLSAIHDISNILMNRIGDKDVEFIGNINPNLPSGLYGDVMRVRQIMINIANNAIKFTQKGYVRVDVDFDKISEDEILLKMAVIDTGIGIREEDLNKLFVSFQQLDSKRNRNIEGTGLGLAICERLVSLMGGTISVSSEYGKGSVFSFAIPQKVTDWTPSFKVKDKENTALVGYWGNDAVYDCLKDVLDRLEVDDCIIIESADDIREDYSELFGDKKVYFFTDYKSYIELLPGYVDRHPEIQFIVACDLDTTYDDLRQNVFLIKKPLSTISIALAINNELFHAMEEETTEADFTAPDAKVLIVDDNDVNLAVAEGLIQPLNMNVTTADSGKKALELLEMNHYDLIFMDHMMPDLDGVETTRIIRRLHPDLADMPIIALSANAMENAREMFLSEGMNDFVAKPIEINTIISKIRQWLPKDKIKQNAGGSNSQNLQNEPEEKLSIGDLDVDSAVKMVGNRKLYLTILKKYYGNMKSKAEAIRSSEASGDIKTYTIEVHALKSASKQIGAMELSEMAAELEACGNAGDIVTIHEKTDTLLDRYLGYADILAPLFEEDNKEADTDKEAISRELLLEYFDKMLGAVEELNLDEMEEIVGDMDKFSYSGDSKGYLEGLKEAIDNIDIDGINEIIDNWKKDMN